MQPKDEISPGPQHGRINHPAAEKKNSPHKPAISARTMATQAMKLEGLAAQRIGWINVSLRTHLYDHWATILPGKERRRSSLYFSLFGCESLHFPKLPPDEERTRTSLQYMYSLSLSWRYVSFWMWKEEGTCIAHSFPDRGGDWGANKMWDSRISLEMLLFFTLSRSVRFRGQQNVGW